MTNEFLHLKISRQTWQSLHRKQPLPFDEEELELSRVSMTRLVHRMHRCLSSLVHLYPYLQAHQGWYGLFKRNFSPTQSKSQLLGFLGKLLRKINHNAYFDSSITQFSRCYQNWWHWRFFYPNQTLIDQDIFKSQRFSWKLWYGSLLNFLLTA